MSLLESIGGLTIIVLAVFIIIQYTLKQENEKRKRQNVIAGSNKCQDLIYRYNKSLKKNKPIMTYQELQQELKRIANSPEELEIYNKEEKSRVERDTQLRIRNRQKRKIGYKYEIEIFEIFSNRREMSVNELIDQINVKFKVEDYEAKELLDLWLDNYLVEYCHWDKRNLEVGSVLTSDYYKIDNNDITRSKYLEENSLILEPRSAKFDEYLRDNTLPF